MTRVKDTRFAALEEQGGYCYNLEILTGVYVAHMQYVLVAIV